MQKRRRSINIYFHLRESVGAERTGKMERREGTDNRGSQLMSMLSFPDQSAQHPSSSAFSFFWASCPLLPLSGLGFEMAPFLFVASGADPGDRPVRPVNAPVSATSPPADPSSRTACPTGGWRCHFPAAVHPVDADLLVCTNRGGAKIHANRARDAVPRMSALHCGLLLCRSTDGEFGNAYPGRGGSPPTPCPSSWGFVLSETL